MKDEFSKLAHIPCIVWGKKKKKERKKGRRNLFLTNLRKDYYKYIGYKHLKHRAASELLLSCFRNVIPFCSLQIVFPW